MDTLDGPTLRLAPAEAMAFRRAWNKGTARAALQVLFDLPDDWAVIEQAEALGLAARDREILPAGRGGALFDRRAAMRRLLAQVA